MSDFLKIARRGKTENATTETENLNPESAEDIIAALTREEWKQDGNDGDPPIPTPKDLIEIKNDNITTEVWKNLDKVWEELDKKEQELWEELDKMRLESMQRALKQHSWDEMKQREEKQQRALCQKYSTCKFRLMTGFMNLSEDSETGILRIHEGWQLARKSNTKLKHPLAPIVRAWLIEQTAKHIDAEYDRKHPVAIIDRNHMGSIRDVIVYPEKDYSLGEIRTSAPPPETSQIEIPGLENKSTLPAILPFQAVKIVDGMETKKNGVYPMPIRLFWEANFALSKGLTQETIRFPLGDMMQFLNPESRYKRHEHLPYVLSALHALYFLRIPYRDNPDNPSTEVDWIPVLPRTVPNINSGDDAVIILDVKLPPDTRQGMMIEKDIIRKLGKYSAAKTNAYLTACWIFDKYGTMRKGIIDPTRPAERRDHEGYLINADGNRILAPRGKPINNLYSPEAIRQLPREQNPSRKKYPILTFDDLTKACYPKGYPRDKQATYNERALKAWKSLEKERIIVIEELPRGWRIMPSDSHIRHYRALTESKKRRN